MVELLVRLFGIFAIAGIGIFCLLDGLNDIGKGYTAALPYYSRSLSNTTRAESPIGFWVGVGLKLSCAGAAFLFVLIYCLVAVMAR